jgi:hypothetical protein
MKTAKTSKATPVAATESITVVDQFGTEATIPAPAAAAPSVPMFKLGGKAAQDRATLQAGGKTGQGKGWRAVATAKPNSRLTALAALANLGDTFTEKDALAALAEIKQHLGSGTPRSYYKAFLASGYIMGAM